MVDYLYNGNPKEVAKMSEMQMDIRGSIYLQILANMEKIPAGKRESVLDRLNASITVEDIKRMSLAEVELCSKYLPDVKVSDVCTQQGIIEADYHKDRQPVPA